MGIGFIMVEFMFGVKVIGPLLARVWFGGPDTGSRQGEVINGFRAIGKDSA